MMKKRKKTIKITKDVPGISYFFQLDSLEKLKALLDACSDLGVETSPKVIEGLGIIPLFSWYHEVISCLVATFGF